jgi:bifunctional non-homologous end joining protein LigD
MAVKTKKSSSPAFPANAIKAELPSVLLPELATLVDAPPNDPFEWVYEIKFDGYRILTRIEREKATLFTRKLNDWSNRLPHIVKAIGEMHLADCWLDGEIVVPNEHGIPDFPALQNAFGNSRTKAIVYYVFDVLFYDGHDLRACSLTQRREFLKALLEKRVTETIRFSEMFDVPAGEILRSACKMGLEGVIESPRVSWRLFDLS